MARIFISYRSTDRESVRMLADDLKQLGHTVWFDPELTSTGGQAWWDNILAQIRACDLFVFALSDDSLASLPCQREYYYADQLQKRILPVVIRPSNLSNLPYELKVIEYVCYEQGSRDQVIALAGSIANLPASLSLPDPLPEPPPVPIPEQERIVSEVEKLLVVAALSEDQQAKILFDIEQLLDDAKYSAKAGELLQRFLERADLLTRISRKAETLARIVPVPKSRNRWILPVTALVGIVVVALVGVILVSIYSGQGTPTPTTASSVAAALTQTFSALTAVALQSSPTTAPSATNSPTPTRLPSPQPPNTPLSIHDFVAQTKAAWATETTAAIASFTKTPTVTLTTTSTFTKTPDIQKSVEAAFTTTARIETAWF